ncbi:MAG: hypothetical protein AAB669_02325 [Patescibacteria group bacterium]
MNLNLARMKMVEVNWLTRRLLIALERTEQEIPPGDERIILGDILSYLLSESLAYSGRNPLKEMSDETTASLLDVRAWCQGRHSLASETARSIVEQTLSLETKH